MHLSIVTPEFLEKKLGVYVDTAGSYEMFSSINAAVSFVKSIQENDCSMSLNYYQSVSNDVIMYSKYVGESALTTIGEKLYKNGTNPAFGLECGDEYIQAYKQGLFLAISINFMFTDSDVKKKFEQKLGDSISGAFGTVNASKNVKSIIKKKKITGSMNLQALQLGGRPSELSNVLGDSEKSLYPVIKCSLAAMDACLNAINNVLRYAKTLYPHNSFLWKEIRQED